MPSISYGVVVAVIAASFVAAQSLQDLQALPQCAQTPAETAFAATGCGLNKPTCVCQNADFQTSLTNEVMKDCSPTDQVAVLKFSTNFCAKAGITVNVPQTAGAAAQSVLNPTPTTAGSSAAAPLPTQSISTPPSAASPLPSSVSSSPSSSSVASVSSSTMYPMASPIVAYNGSNSTVYGGTVLSFTGDASMNSALFGIGISVITSIMAAFVV